MEAFEQARRPGSRSSSRRRTPAAFRVCDGLTEGLLYFQAVFAPWAFGATESWSIATLNAAGYALGGLLLARRWICHRWKYRPARWDDSGRPGGGVDEGPWAEKPGEASLTGGRASRASPGRARPRATTVTATLVALTVLILGYCLVSAANARSTFLPREMAFVPHDHVAWLPHSLDGASSWRAFAMYLALALSFWAARDWLLGKTAAERRGERDEAKEEGAGRGGDGPHVGVVPGRLRRLLWVLCLNGALLALEAILQRISGTDKLLWLVRPYLNQSAELQFGPYAYRSNAAQYFNLLWPVCLGFWWTLRRVGSDPTRRRAGGRSHVLLLPCALLLATAPILSTSRGGALVAAAQMSATVVLFLLDRRRSSPRPPMPAGVILLFLLATAAAGFFGWEKLGPRLKKIPSDDLGGRIEIYRNAESMARDFPVYGSGPGTFAAVYHLYREHGQALWAAYAHNDWLETRITLGRVGLVLILAALATVFLRGFAGGGIVVDRTLVLLIWLALAGCLVHARFDFPFQVYSTLALFVELCAILFCLSRPRGEWQGRTVEGSNG